MTTKACGSCGGQVLIETLVMLPVQLLCAGLILLATLSVFVTVTLHADAYSLARSSLYGTPRPCHPAAEWPKISGLYFRYECTGHGQVHAHAQFQYLSWNWRETVRVRLRSPQ